MADEQSEKSRLDELHERLYSRGQEAPKFERSELGRNNTADLHIRRNWQEPDHAPETPAQSAPAVAAQKASSGFNMSFLRLFFVFSILFFLGAVVVATYFVFFSSNTVSAQNIAVDIEGPVSIAGGDELSLNIAIANNNSVDIESVDLFIEYPIGTQSAVDPETPLLRDRNPLGTIRSGEVVNAVARSIPFGEEGEERHVNVTIEYRIEGSSAIFFKEVPFDFTISSAPIVVRVDSLENVISGQPMEMKVEVASNATSPITDLLLTADYPFGFDVTSIEPRGLSGDGVWSVGTLEPGEVKEFTIRGVLNGQDGETRAFRFVTGQKSERSDREIGTIYSNATLDVTVERPFLSLDVRLNGVPDEEFVAKSGERIRAEITWINNLPTQIFDGEITATLKGEVLDRATISAGQGFYNSANDTIYWSEDTNSDLGEIKPGQKSFISFSFNALDGTDFSKFRTPEIDFELNVEGRRVSDDNVPQTITSSVSRNIKIASNVELFSRALYSVGPFANTGPVPPVVEKTTTYTIVWTVTNSSNSVSNTTVETSVPRYMAWLNQVSPSNADIFYDPIDNSIRWNAGDMEAGDTKEVAFQVSILPSLSQVSSAPVIMNEQTVRATDRFTQTTVSNVYNPLTTSLVNDPDPDLSDGTVER